MHNCQHLGVGNHRIVFSCNIEIALVELSIATFGDGRLVPSVYFTDMEPFYFLDVGVVGHEAGEGDGQIVPQ